MSVAEAPKSAVAAAVIEKRRARRAELLKTYRAAVIAEAKGEKAGAKTVDAIVDIVDELNLPPESFANDVEASKLDLSYVQSSDGCDARLASLIAETEPIPAKLSELRQQIADLERQDRVAQQGIRSIHNLRQQHEHLKRCNPRLFHADLEVALAAQSAAFDPGAIFNQRRN